MEHVSLQDNGVAPASAASGMIRLMSSERNAEKRPAAFVDRDGTIIIDKNYLQDPDGVQIPPGAVEALKRLRLKGYLLIVISNQAGVGRGLFGEDALRAVHARMIEMYRNQGVEFEATYYCPHAPDAGCGCRKPATGMLERACKDFNIDTTRSFMAGDSDADENLARNFGIRFFRIGEDKAADWRKVEEAE